MKQFIIAAVLFMAVLIAGYAPDDHKHIWVIPVSDTIRIEQTSTMVSGVHHWPQSGWQKGEEMVCMKCFVRKHQMIDYGAPEYMNLPVPPADDEPHEKTLLKK